MRQSSASEGFGRIEGTWNISGKVVCHYCVLTSAVAIFCAAIFSYFNLIIFLRLIKTFLKILYLFFFLLFFCCWCSSTYSPTVLTPICLWEFHRKYYICFISACFKKRKGKTKDIVSCNPGYLNLIYSQEWPKKNQDIFLPPPVLLFGSTPHPVA